MYLHSFMTNTAYVMMVLVLRPHFPEATMDVPGRKWQLQQFDEIFLDIFVQSRSSKVSSLHENKSYVIIYVLLWYIKTIVCLNIVFI